MQKLFGPYGTTDAQTAKNVRACGGNAIWFHGFNPSGFEAAESGRVAACVEFKTFRASFDEHPELIPIGADGKPIRYGRLVQGICLSHDEYLHQRFDDLANGMSLYHPKGVWLDYLTYAGWFETPTPDLQESCFCEACVEEFCAATGIDAESPSEILQHHQQSWTSHKCSRIDILGREFSRIIRDAAPECVIGVYMCPWKPGEFDGALSRIFAQDYGLFIEWADLFSPLLYAEKSGRSKRWSETFMNESESFLPAGAVVAPILDSLDFPECIEAIADATIPPSGFQLFAGATTFEDKTNLSKIGAAIERIAQSLEGS